VKTPVILWPEVLLPGIPGELTLDLSTATALSEWHDYMGFGTSEVLLMPSADATIATLAQVAPLDETTFDIAGSELAAVTNHEEPKKGRKGWAGAMANATPTKVERGSVDGDALRKAVIAHLMVAADDPQEVVDAVIELGVRDAPDWKIVFWAAHMVLEDPEERLAALTAPLADTVEVVRAQLEVPEDIQTDFEALLGGVMDGPLQASIDGLGACERLGSLGLGVRIPERDRKTLRSVRKQLEEAVGRIEKMLE
jgi:hypothetical protein